MLALKRAAAGPGSSRCHETPLKAPREFRRWRRDLDTRLARVIYFFIIFFFFFFFFVVAMI